MLLLQSAGLAIAQSAPAAAEEAKTEQEKQLLTHEQRTLLERLFISSACTTGNVLDVPSTITVIDCRIGTELGTRTTAAINGAPK